MTNHALHTNFGCAATAARRDQNPATALTRFTLVCKPIVFRNGQGRNLRGKDGWQQFHMLGTKARISVGHPHLRTVSAAMGQAQDMTHVPAMSYHTAPAYLAGKPAANMPNGHGGAMHLTKFRAEATDLLITSRTRRPTVPRQAAAQASVVRTARVRRWPFLAWSRCWLSEN